MKLMDEKVEDMTFKELLSHRDSLNRRLSEVLNVPSDLRERFSARLIEVEVRIAEKGVQSV